VAVKKQRAIPIRWNFHKIGDAAWQSARVTLDGAETRGEDVKKKIASVGKGETALMVVGIKHVGPSRFKTGG
jgi:hypothetical protein